MKLFLWALKEVGVPDVPSLYRLRKMQKELRTTSGVPTLRCDSVQGNVFFMNDPRHLIAQVSYYIALRDGSFMLKDTIGLVQSFNPAIHPTLSRNT